MNLDNNSRSELQDARARLRHALREFQELVVHARLAAGVAHVVAFHVSVDRGHEFAQRHRPERIGRKAKPPQPKLHVAIEREASAEAVDKNAGAAQEIETVWSGLGENLKGVLAGSLQSFLDGNIKSIGDFVNQAGGAGAGLLKKFVGNKATEALSGMLGSLSSFAGPLGGAIGAAAGALAGKAVSALGKVLGGKPSDKIEGVNLDLIAGTRREGDLGPNKDSPENRQLSNSLEQRFLDFQNLLKSWSLNPTAPSALIEVGAGKNLAPYRAAVGGSGVQSFQTADQAFAFMAEQLIASLETVPARVQAAVDNFDPANIEAFVAELQKIADFDKGIENVRDEIQKLTDPKQWELDQLSEEFRALREQAVAFQDDAALAIIDQLIALRTADINARYMPPPEIVQPSAPSQSSQLTELLTPFTDQLAEALNPRQFELDKLAREFARLRTEADELGATAEQLAALRQLEGIQRAEIDARHNAPFNDMMKSVRSDMAQMANPEAWELDQLQARYDEMKALANGHTAELLELEDWYGAQRTQITERYAEQAA